jgi:hypothetical protein
MEEVIQLLPFAIWSVISLIPALSLCKRVGKTRWWSAFVIIPFAGPIIFMFIFILAYSRWVTPTLDLVVTPPKQVQRLEPKLLRGGLAWRTPLVGLEVAEIATDRNLVRFVVGTDNQIRL